MMEKAKEMEKKKIFLWGTGLIANRLMTCVSGKSHAHIIIGFLDSDEKKWGEKFWNREIFSPDVLKTASFDAIVIACKCVEEVKEQIAQIDVNYLQSVYTIDYYIQQELLCRYKDSNDEEILSIVKYIEKNGLKIFNYDFTSKYQALKPAIFFDDTCHMYYLYHEGKKMYFSRKLDTAAKVLEYYKSICWEQDKDSPHRYLGDITEIPKDAVVVDAGVAEGNFSLDIIDRVRKIYLIEVDKDWIDALHMTFENYMDKVVFVNKFLSNEVNEQCDTLDNIIIEPVDFLKMDIEGCERDALEGAKEMLDKSKNIKCAICAYHRHDDEIVIRKLLESAHISCTTTKGYMWYPTYGTNKEIISLRKGVVKGEKRG